jgi:hypothetical protein
MDKCVCFSKDHSKINDMQYFILNKKSELIAQTQNKVLVGQVTNTHQNF